MSKFNRDRILVTGGAGFLGSHLIDRLLERGNEVLCVDNLFTGDKSNIDHLVGHPRFEFMRHDITFPLFVEVDQIYNLACPASPIHYQFDPVQTTKTSVTGAINMLGLAKRVKARVFQASTSEIYGDPSVHPQPESYWGNVNTIGPRACYDEGKRCAEYGDGQQTRSFCYVDDLVEGFLRMMDTGPDFPGPINLGNPNEFTIRELAEAVLELTGSKSELVREPLPQDDPRQRQPDISLAKKSLDWEPKTQLREGLTKTIKYFDAMLRERGMESVGLTQRA